MSSMELGMEHGFGEMLSGASGGKRARIPSYELEGMNDMLYQAESYRSARLYAQVSVAVAAALLLQACSGGVSVDQAVDKLNSTGTPVAAYTSPTPFIEDETVANPIVSTPVEKATQTSTPSAVPVETQESTVRIEPTPYEKIVVIDVVRRELENRYLGGYFIGKPNVEDLSQYLMLDFSHSGRLKVVEGKDLDENSWGLYAAKEFEGVGGGFADGEGISGMILHVLYHTNGGVTVDWGELSPGTKIFIPQRYLDSAEGASDLPDGFFIQQFPISDQRYKCESVSNAPSGEGIMNDPGILCEYI
jgi:hypothetical protein